MGARRILVAGGAGFLGSHACGVLLMRGDQVVCLDNLSTGSRSNVEALMGHSGLTFVEADICLPLPVTGQFDQILNFACPASPKDFASMPLEILDVSSVGVRRLLDLAADTGATFLQTSTSEVYGEPEVHPQVETYWGNVNPIGPRSCYDEAKRFAEALVVAHSQSRGTNVRIVRIFNTYGPRMRAEDGRVVVSFIASALAGKPLTIHGDGTQTRSFCYVDDEVRGILMLADSNVSGPVNIGNPNEFTIMELAELVIDVTGSSSEIVLVDRPVDDPSRRRPDIGRARDHLGWEPTVQLREGLQRMAAWMAGV